METGDEPSAGYMLLLTQLPLCRSGHRGTMIPVLLHESAFKHSTCYPASRASFVHIRAGCAKPAFTYHQVDRFIIGEAKNPQANAGQNRSLMR